MYVGRIVAIGKTAAGSNALLYRVSSRSYQDRKALLMQDLVRIVPREGSL
ncbi:MAG: hypothetical protein HY677_02690 [Chloroflexi bacterium]|nr:hypothetical protein [Chloroflexota bacterium]